MGTHDVHPDTHENRQSFRFVRWQRRVIHVYQDENNAQKMCQACGRSAEKSR